LLLPDFLLLPDEVGLVEASIVQHHHGKVLALRCLSGQGIEVS